MVHQRGEGREGSAPGAVGVQGPVSGPVRYRGISLWVQGGLSLGAQGACLRSRVCTELGSPLVHEVGDDRCQQAEQHDSSAGIHHGVQEVPWVLGRGQDTLQILQDREPQLGKFPG